MKMLEGQFTLDDFLEQIRMIQKMGSLKDLVGKMPGMGDMLPARTSTSTTSELVRIEAIIRVFTKFERKRPLRPHPRAVARRRASRRAPAQPEQQVRSSCRSSSS